MTAIDNKRRPRSEPDPADGTVLRSHAVRGAGWMLVWRFCERLAAIFSTFILVRLLTPADFGVFAMAMLAVQIIEIFGETGQALALIRLGKPSRAHFDTAWTIQVLTYLCLAICVLISAPLAGLYFQSSAVQTLVAFLSLRLAINAFSNIGVVTFRIDFDFAADVRLGIYQKLLAMVVALTLAALWRNYWALAVGVVATKLIAVLLSYGMHPYRPRFSLQKVSDLWNFSFWVLVVTVSEYFTRKVDQLIVGALATPHTMGAYHVAEDLATTPTVDLVQPIMRALFPIYSRLMEDMDRFRNSVLVTLGGTTTICLASGPGLAMVASEVVAIFLGPGWEEAKPLMFWLAIGSIPVGINYSLYMILTITGNARLGAFTIWTRMALLVPGLLIGAAANGVTGIAEARAVIGLVVLCFNFYLLKRTIAIGIVDLWNVMWRPSLGMLVMLGVLSGLNTIPDLPAIGSLFLKITIGALTYSMVVGVAWNICGRPDGIEAIALAISRRLIATISDR